MTTLLVCRSAQIAVDMKRLNLLGPNVEACGYGAALCGRGYDRILVTKRPSKRETDWIKNHLRCRLLPGGVLRYI